MEIRLGTTQATSKVGAAYREEDQTALSWQPRAAEREQVG